MQDDAQLITNIYSSLLSILHISVNKRLTITAEKICLRQFEGRIRNVWLVLKELTNEKKITYFLP